MVRIHIAALHWTYYSLVHGYEHFGGEVWVYVHRPSEDGSSKSWSKPPYPPIRLHSSITQNTVISDLNILHFPCIISLFITN